MRVVRKYHGVSRTGQLRDLGSRAADGEGRGACTEELGGCWEVLPPSPAKVWEAL